MGGRIRHPASQFDPAQAWLWAPFRQTGVIAIMLVLHYLLVGFIFDIEFPQADTVFAALRTWMQ